MANMSSSLTTSLVWCAAALALPFLVGACSDDEQSAQGGAGRGNEAGEPSVGSAGSGEAGSAGDAAAGAGGSAPQASVSCDSPELDPTTQLERCANGFSHRPTPAKCSLFPDGGPVLGAGGAGSEALCHENSDCERAGDVCVPGGTRNWATLTCARSCLEDADCGMGDACLCDGSAHGGVCRTVRCAGDADCGEASLCTFAATGAWCGEPTLYCMKPSDECVSDDDCPAAHACQWGACVESGTCE